MAPRLRNYVARPNGAEHQLRGLDEYLVLRGSNLGLDDLDCQVFLPAAGEPGGAIPNAGRALVEIHGSKDGMKSGRGSMSTNVGRAQ